MNSIVSHKAFLLGIEANWDSYIEIQVKFLRIVKRKALKYAVFISDQTKDLYYLSPRYVETQIEDLIYRDETVVNISKIDANSYQQNGFSLNALGMLKKIQ